VTDGAGLEPGPIGYETKGWEPKSSQPFYIRAHTSRRGTGGAA